MNPTKLELLADLKTFRAIVRVMDENKKGYLERIASLEAELTAVDPIAQTLMRAGHRPEEAMRLAINGRVEAALESVVPDLLSALNLAVNCMKAYRKVVDCESEIKVAIAAIDKATKELL